MTAKNNDGNGGLYTAIALSAMVWLAVSIMNFEEQARWARAAEMPSPELLPLAFDGMYVSLAVVALVASLDGRAAIPARMGTLLAVVASSAVSGNAAYLRTTVDDPNSYAPNDMIYRVDTVIIVAAMPWIALVAFEVALIEVRRRVQKARGRKSPAPIPFPRAVRWLLAPLSTSTAWRRVVLSVTDQEMILNGESVQVEVQEEPVQVEIQEEQTVSVTRSVTRRTGAGRRTVPDDEYVPDARRAYAQLAESGERITRDRFVSTMKELGAGVSTVRATRLLAREDVTS